MNSRSDSLSIHPYFKVHPGRLAEFKSLFPKFVERTATEPKCLYYGFTTHGDEVHCREAYADADGLLAHLENVGALLGEALKLAEIARLEVHGPAAELEKLKGPLGHLNPTWFVFETGLAR